MKKWCKIVEHDGADYLFFMEPHYSHINKTSEWWLHQMVLHTNSRGPVCYDVTIKGIRDEDAEATFSSINEESAKLVFDFLKVEYSPDAKQNDYSLKEYAMHNRLGDFDDDI